VKWAGPAVAIAAVAFVVAGCAPFDPEPLPTIYEGPYDWELSELSAEQQAAIEDGVITGTEYEEGYSRYSECLSDAGYPLIDEGMRGTVHEFLVPAAATDVGIEPGCYIREFAAVDSTWQIVGSPRS
jgi:hypothetical protein